MIKAPQCLHVPTLYENETRTVSWEGNRAVERYELEGVFDRKFQDVVIGVAWYDIKRIIKSWKDGHEKEQKWKEIHGLPTKGLTWRNLAAQTKLWNEILAPEYSWNLLADKPASTVIYSGPGTAITGAVQEGLGWGDLKAVKLTWRCAHSADKSWKEIKENESHNDHLGAEVGISLNSKQAEFRIRTVTEGDYSDYFTADLEKVIPIFQREDIFQFPVQKGQSYLVQLTGNNMSVFQGVHMQVTYDKDTLALAYVSESQLDKADVRILAQYNGALRFTCFKEIADAMEWSGTILNLEFKALKTGTANIEIQ